MEIDPKAVSLVPMDLIQRYGVLPIRADETSVTIALSDPLAYEAIDLLRFTLGSWRTWRPRPSSPGS